MSEFVLEDLLERAHASENKEARAIARGISNDWNQKVLPSSQALAKLHKLLAVPPACTRLGYDGRCGGWLKKYGAECGLVVIEPYTCPFASDGVQASDFPKCPGYQIV